MIGQRGHDDRGAKVGADVPGGDAHVPAEGEPLGPLVIGQGPGRHRVDRLAAVAAAAPADFGGPMAKVNRMVLIVAAALYTAFAPAGWQPSIAAVPKAGALALALMLIIAGCVMTSARRLRRCAQTLEAGGS